MTRRPPLSSLVILAFVLLACILVKWQARRASAQDLDWLLAPTSRLAGFCTGEHFVRESGAGYLDRERMLLIAPACAGVNYLVLVFFALAAGFLPRFGELRRKLCWIPLAAALAYVATVTTNGLRIAVSIFLRPLFLSFADAERAQVHRVEGIVIYLSSLLLVYQGVGLALGVRAGARRAPLWFPVLLYLGITLGVPLLLGGYLRPDYPRHAWVVIVVGGAVAALFLLVTRRVSTRSAKGRSRLARLSGRSMLGRRDDSGKDGGSHALPAVR
jgi:exosortase K